MLTYVSNLTFSPSWVAARDSMTVLALNNYYRSANSWITSKLYSLRRVRSWFGRAKLRAGLRFLSAVQHAFPPSGLNLPVVGVPEEALEIPIQPWYSATCPDRMRRNLRIRPF